MVKEGYEIESSDKNFYLITTKETEKRYGAMGMGILSVKFFLQFDQEQNNTIIKVLGKVYSSQLFYAAGAKTSNFDKDATRISRSKTKNSIMGASWIIMDDLSRKYTPGVISYNIEE